MNVGESGATQDTALYTNLRTSSRPSSMLFNDAGFVRFRIGNDAPVTQADLLRQSCQDLVNAEGSEETSVNPSVPDKAADSSMKGSRSFDNAVLDNKKQLSGESFRMSPLERPQSNMSYVKEKDGNGILLLNSLIKSQLYTMLIKKCEQVKILF